MSSETTATCLCGGAGCDDCAAAAARPAVADPVAFRHSAIRTRMVGRIARAPAAGGRPLAALGTRAPDDPAIALIDAAAGAAHVLAWTADRLYRDGTIGQTEDRAALAALTGLLGYLPRPAISAATVMAFTLDDLPGAPGRASLPRGMKIASVPGQNELPLTFELDEALEAEAAWNALAPVRAELPPAIGTATTEIAVTGVATAARPGDMVLVRANPPGGTPPDWIAARVTEVRREPAHQPPRTILGLAAGRTVKAEAALEAGAGGRDVILLGQRAQAFGATAPDLRLMNEDIRRAQIPPSPPGVPVVVLSGLPTQWLGFEMDPAGSQTGGEVHLDVVVAEAAPGGAVLFQRPSGTPAIQLGRITATREAARTDFGLSAKCTVIGVAGIDLRDSGFNLAVRQTAIHVETARETLHVPLDDPALPASATPDRIVVAGEAALPPGRRVVLTGPAADGSGPLAEAAVVLDAIVGAGQTEIVFDAPLAGQWRASGVAVLGNCASASEGETPASGPETVGSGNPTQALQRFALRRMPLAHVPAPGPRGFAPAIEVRVGGRLYGPVETLYGAGAEHRVFQVLARRDGGAEVQFAGRLPSGSGNVEALYRKGGGAAGNLAAGRITTQLAPVLGVRAATNPLPAEGGSDPETLEAMRLAAPKSIRTLDRAVSLADFEAFALGYRGVTKALASELRAGMRRVVCVTIATTALAPPAPGSTLPGDLSDALAAAAPPGTALRVEGFAALAGLVTLKLATDPALDRAAVEATARDAIAAAFSPVARGFAQAIHRSEVLAAAQGAPGVIAATLTSFARADGAAEDAGRLLSPAPRLDGNDFVPAGLLSIALADILFEEMAP